METIHLKTLDSIDLAADYYAVEKPWMAAVYAHMMPATKESWRKLAEYLAINGIAGIAIDLRGHGQSALGPDGYKNFMPADHQKSVFDIRGAVDLLRSARPELAAEKIMFIGASIGANLSLQFIAEHRGYKTAVLLSAGLNYHGVNAEVLIKKLIPGQKVFFAACHDDLKGGGDNAAQNEILFEEVPSGVVKAKKIYEAGGHGTDILSADKSLPAAILKFIKNGML